MPIDSGNLALKGLDDLFSTEENRQEEQREQVQQIPIDALHPFTNHPFKVLDDEAMTRTVESIAQYGVLAPLIARPRPDGDGYEIISGHRRQYAAKLAGLDTLPVIVRQMSDDAAVILMVDSNLQREHILPSERALAYKMKLEAIKNQGARSDLTSPQVAAKFRSDDAVAKDQGISGDTVRRYIRLTNLIPELLDMVDEKKISFNPAVELSYLDESQQRDFLEAMNDTQNAPSLSQAQQLKKMAQQGEFSYEKAFDVMGQEKRSEKDTVTILNVQRLGNLWNTLLYFTGFGTCDGKGQRNIFIGGQGVQKIEILENKPQLFSTEICKLCSMQHRDILFLYIDMTAGDGINRGNAVQQGGFARARSTHDAEKFSFANRKRNVVDGFCQVAFVTVKFLDVIHP